MFRTCMEASYKRDKVNVFVWNVTCGTRYLRGQSVALTFGKSRVKMALAINASKFGHFHLPILSVSFEEYAIIIQSCVYTRASKISHVWDNCVTWLVG